MALKRLKVLVAHKAKLSLNAAITVIADGRVTINGVIGRATSLVGSGDTVLLDGIVLPTQEELAYVLFYKPRGIECTMNENIEANLQSVFKHTLRLFPVGRLDKDSEGLLFMTNHGKLYHQIAHADSQKEKEYYVEVHKAITPEFLEAMRSGVKILNTITDPCHVYSDADNDHAFRIILRQGMNRQIRRMCYNLGYSVQRLVRTRIMHMQIGELKPGEWRELSKEELRPLQMLIT